jgi:hypothetical protein
MSKAEEFDRSILRNMIPHDPLAASQAAYLLMNIVTDGRESGRLDLDRKYESLHNARELIEGDPELLDLLTTAWKERTFYHILDLGESPSLSSVAIPHISHSRRHCPETLKIQIPDFPHTYIRSYDVESIGDDIDSFSEDSSSELHLTDWECMHLTPVPVEGNRETSVHHGGNGCVDEDGDLFMGASLSEFKDLTHFSLTHSSLIADDSDDGPHDHSLKADVPQGEPADEGMM